MALAVCAAQLAVVLGVAVAELPGSIHLVAQAPHRDSVGLDAAVLDPHVRAAVVPDRMLAYSRTSSASRTPRVPRLTAYISSLSDLLQPPGELVQADLVGLGGVPGQIQPGRSFLPRADRVLPAEPGDEVAAGVADRRDTELANQRDHVGSEAVGVGGRGGPARRCRRRRTGPGARRRSRRTRRWTGPTVKWGSSVSSAEGMAVLGTGYG